ncbi:7 transmembrane receptor (rhodopsin family) domain-containing protein [Ditylenchus destructor]|nr:7 transmembrane receptor (rhodopsin family) domain-containing protein [Ditylenchus destructor]
MGGWPKFGGVLLLASAVGIVLNSVSFIGVVATLNESKRKRSLVTTASLSVASIGLSFLHIIDWAPVAANTNKKWPFGKWLCGPFNAAETAFQYIFSISILLVAKDRYDNTRSHTHSNEQKHRFFLIIFLWIIAAVLSGPEFFFYKSTDQHCVNEYINETVSRAYDLLKVSVTLPLPLIIDLVYFINVIVFFARFKIPTQKDLTLSIWNEQRRLVTLTVVSTIFYFAASAINALKVLRRNPHIGRTPQPSNTLIDKFSWLFEVHVSEAVMLVQSFALNFACALCGVFPVLIDRRIMDCFFHK